MKNIFAAILLILSFCLFSIFIFINMQTKTVLSVDTPTKINIDLDNDKIKDSNELVCIEGIESFSTEPDDKFISKYSNSLHLSREDIISLGYLAEDFSQKLLENQKVSVKFTPKTTVECRFGNITINDLDYKKILKESGFGIVNGKIGNKDKFSKNLELARKLNLVILNHHSNKYHTLTCPYGNAAHDKIIIPRLQLPKNAKPCKFCHKQQYKFKKENFTKTKNPGINSTIQELPQPSLVISEGNLKVVYTDFTRNLKPSDQCINYVCKSLVQLINNSKETIDIAIYGYDDNPTITNALIQAHNRGIKIRFVYDEAFNPLNTYYKDNNIITNLSTAYKSDRTDSAAQSNMLMHNKFVIFDNNTVYTGSMNFSNTGLSGYDVNNIIIINSKEIANLYSKEFEQMLNGKFHNQKEKLNIPNKFILGKSQIEIYFSPKDKASVRIIELIKNAKHYIYIPTFLITHTQIANELINAKNRGIDVRVIIDANSTSTRNTKHAILRKNGILLKTENYAGKLHAKSMIIDDEYIVTGSMNFSNSGENKNDENLLIIKNSTIAKSYKNFFLYLWTKIPNKYLKYNAKPESKDSIGSCTDGIDNNFNGKIDKEEVNCR